MEKNIGALLRNRRKELGLTMQQVASACNVSASTVCRWETGYINDIKRGSLYLLASVLYLPIETIIGVETDKKLLDSMVIIKVQELERRMYGYNLEELRAIETFMNAFIEKKK